MTLEHDFYSYEIFNLKNIKIIVVNKMYKNDISPGVRKQVLDKSRRSCDVKKVLANQSWCRGGPESEVNDRQPENH